MDSTSLQIDFGDPADIRDKLPRVRELLAEKEAQLEAARHDVNVWRRALITLMELADIPTPEAEPGDQASAADGTDDRQPERIVGVADHENTQLERVVGVVDRENRPIRPREVAETLRQEGFGIDNNKAASMLYYAALRATPPRIRKLSQRGLYAPQSYVDPPQTDYEHAGRLGFPVPEHLAAGDDGDDDP
jgi:hypothetical protein